MRNIAFYLFILLGVFLSSCAAKKKVSTTIVERSSDTLSYVLPTENNFIVSTLCDSIDRPLEFIKTIDTGVSETTLEVKDNKLVLQVKTDTVYKDRIVYKDKFVEVDRDVVRYKIPAWVWFSYAGITLIVLIAYRWNRIKSFARGLL